MKSGKYEIYDKRKEGVYIPPEAEKKSKRAELGNLKVKEADF